MPEDGRLLAVRFDRADAPKLVLEGDLDLSQVALLEKAVEEVPEGIGEKLVFDLTGLRFMDSSGLRAMLTAQRELLRRGVEISLLNPAPIIRRVLEVTQTDRILTIVDA
jgi:anti-anti-sigma factor